MNIVALSVMLQQRYTPGVVEWHQPRRDFNQTHFQWCLLPCNRRFKGEHRDDCSQVRRVCFGLQRAEASDFELCNTQWAANG
jgi:hypothetical protein